MLKPDVQERPKEHRLDLPDKQKAVRQDRLRHNYYLVRNVRLVLEVEKQEPLSVNLEKKPEELPCNRKHLDAIKRIEISNSHGTHTNHNRMVRYSI